MYQNVHSRWHSSANTLWLEWSVSHSKLEEMVNSIFESAFLGLPQFNKDQLYLFHVANNHGRIGEHVRRDIENWLKFWHICICLESFKFAVWSATYYLRIPFGSMFYCGTTPSWNSKESLGPQSRSCSRMCVHTCDTHTLFAAYVWPFPHIFQHIFQLELSLQFIWTLFILTQLA